MRATRLNGRALCLIVAAQALHAAIAADHLQVVRLLLTRGMLVPDSAIELSRKLGHDNVLELLEKWRSLVLTGASYDLAAEPELPLLTAIPDTVPEARNHHFLIDEKAGECGPNAFLSRCALTMARQSKRNPAS